MKTDSKSFILFVSLVLLVACGLFWTDWKTGRGRDANTSTPVTPAASSFQPTTLQNVSAALPSFSDFLKSDPQVVQAAQPQEIPTTNTVTGWLDPTLGKVIIVDGVNRKMKCDGLEQNTDFGRLNESQKMLAKDACSQL